MDLLKLPTIFFKVYYLHEDNLTRAPSATPGSSQKADHLMRSTILTSVRSGRPANRLEKLGTPPYSAGLQEWSGET